MPGGCVGLVVICQVAGCVHLTDGCARVCN